MKNKNIFLFLQGGLGNQLYQLLAAYSFSNKGNFYIDEVYFYHSDVFKRTPNYSKIVTELNSESIKINFLIVLFLRVIIKLAIHKIIKPAYFDDETRDCVVKIFNSYFMIGYFQNSNWFNFIKLESNQNYTHSFLNDFLLNGFRTEENCSDQICIHIRNLQIDYIIAPDYFIEKFDTIHNNYNFTRSFSVVITSEDNKWISDYEKLNNHLLLKGNKILNVTDFNDGITSMIFSKVFIGTKSTLSDWISFIREFNNFQNSLTFKYEQF
jgi:hypothetical protein